MVCTTQYVSLVLSPKGAMVLRVLIQCISSVPSTWTPPIIDVELEFYLRETEDKLLNINESGKSCPNLSRDEREALHSLMNDDEIVIKPAD